MNAANAPINAHVWAAHAKLAWLATAIGRPSAEANQYAATAAALKRGIVGHLARPASACDPPTGPCFADGVNESHTSVQAGRNPLLATENLLENTDARGRWGVSEHPMSVLSGRQPAAVYLC